MSERSAQGVGQGPTPRSEAKPSEGPELSGQGVGQGPTPRSEAKLSVARLVEEFGEIVRPEGGSVELLSVEGETLRIAYRPGHNEQCASCVISPENLRDMLLDVLPQHDPSIRRVEVSCP